LIATLAAVLQHGESHFCLKIQSIESHKFVYWIYKKVA